MPFDVVQQAVKNDPPADSPGSSDPPSTTRELTSQSLAILCALTFLAVAVLMEVAGLSLRMPRDYAEVATGSVAAGLLFRPLLSRQADSRTKIAWAFMEYLGLLAFISLCGVIATYPLASLSRGYCDSVLVRADEALRFNWASWYGLVSAHRSLQLAGRFFYESVFVTPVALCAYFACFGQRARAHLFIASYWLSVALTLALFAMFPAQGPLAHLQHGLIAYMPKNGLYQPALIDGLKHHRISAVSLDDLRGLVSVPSFHTTAAVLFIMSAWPLQKLRVPVLLLNLAMLASIPVEGTHYLSDMIAGGLVAIVAHGTMLVLLRRRSEAAADVSNLRAVAAS